MTHLLLYLPDISGTVLAYRKLALGRMLHLPCAGLECTEADLDSCASVDELSRCFVQRLETILAGVTALFILGFSSGCTVGCHVAALLQERMAVQLVLVDGPVPVPITAVADNGCSNELDVDVLRLARVFAPAAGSHVPAFSGPVLYIESSESREQFERDGTPRDAVLAAEYYPQAKVVTIAGTHQGIMLDHPAELVQQVSAFFLGSSSEAR